MAPRVPTVGCRRAPDCQREGSRPAADDRWPAAGDVVYEAGMRGPLRSTCVLGALVACVAGCAPAGPRVPAAGPPAPAAVLATIPVGRPPTLLAISPDGVRVYAASSGTLSIIRTDTNTVAVSVPSDPYPAGIAVTPDGSRVLLTSLSSVRLAVYDAISGAPAAAVGLIEDIPPGGFGRIAPAPGGRTAYVTNQPRQYLALADLAAGTSSESLLDLRPSDVALARDGTLYVAGCREFCTTGTVEVLDAASRNTIRALAVGPGPYRIALSPDGGRAYTADLGGPSLSVLELASGALRATVPVGTEPTGLAVSPDGTRVYVVSRRDGTMTLVDAAHDSVVGTIAIGTDPREIVLAPDGRRAYVSTRDAVLVLDTGAL